MCLPATAIFLHNFLLSAASRSLERRKVTYSNNPYSVKDLSLLLLKTPGSAYFFYTTVPEVLGAFIEEGAGHMYKEEEVHIIVNCKRIGDDHL